MKKIRTLLILMIALLTITCPAAAASQKTAVKKVTKNFMKAVKTLDDAKMTKYTNGGEESDGIGQESVLFKTIRKYNKKYFSYKIKKVTVSADQTRASVKVSLKYKSLYKVFYHSCLQAMNKTYKLAQQKKEISEKQILKFIEKNTKKNIRKYPPKTKKVKMTIKLVKTEGEWKIDADSLKSLDPFVCDMLKGLLKAQKDFKK